MDIQRYAPELSEEWDDFVRESNNGTLFHYRSFLSYHQDRTFLDHSLLFRKGGHIVAVFPAAELEQEGKRVLYSHPGASFGGFVFHRLPYSDADDLVQLFEDYAREQGFDSTFFVPPPLFYFKKTDQTLEYVLRWRGYAASETYISSVIELDRPYDELLGRVCRRKKRSRRFFRRLITENDVVMDWCDDFESFYPILEENKARHDRKPTHSLEELFELKRRFPDEINLLLMRSGDTPVGGTLLFTGNSDVVIIFYNMIDYGYSHLQPATLQVLESMRWAEERGFTRLDFGVSQKPQAPNPLTPSPSLIRFKEELCSHAMIRQAFEKSFD